MTPPPKLQKDWVRTVACRVAEEGEDLTQTEGWVLDLAAWRVWFSGELVGELFSYQVYRDREERSIVYRNIGAEAGDG